jgi:hypothetical protein
MIGLFRSSLMICWLCLLSSPVLSQLLPDPDDYAYSFPLTVAGDRQFFELDIPLEVYRSVSDSSLRDTGVYNSKQQPVPRLFERPATPDGSEEQISLGLVPLDADVSEQPEQLRLLLQQAGRGITMKLDSSETGEPDDANPLKAYIVDTRDLEHELVALVFHWPKQAQGFIGRLTVEHGDNLQHWRHLGAASLADLEYDKTHIVQNRVGLTGKASDYLRISWHNMPEGWKLDAVMGIYTMAGAPGKRDELLLDATPDSSESAREFVFNADGFPPVDRLKLVLPDENVVVRATIFSRMNEEDSWHRSHSGIFYNLSKQDASLRSPPARVAVTRARQWKVKLESGVTNTSFQLQLGWQPDRLVFLAQGAPPFELVTGRAQDRLQGFPQDSILGDRSIFRMLRESGQAGSATAGNRRLRGGLQQLEVVTTKSWRIVLLWAGLIAAVLLVGWLVYSLMRDMRKDEKAGK